jgi:NAD-dependent DNA ligase
MSISGMKIVLTGTFSELKRSEAQAQLEELGADVTGSVSKNTQLLFAGEKAGSKLARARDLGVPVYGEAELLETLKTGEVPAGESVAPPNPRESLTEAPVAAADRASKNESIEGLRFVITGEISGLDRNEAKKALTDLGAKVTGTVSGKTDYVVVGVNAGANKLADAEEKGVPLLTQEQYGRLLAGESIDDVAGE